MIIVDTNIISEIMKPECSNKVVDWYDLQGYGFLLVTSPSLAELHFGIEKLPHSKKRNLLSESLAIVLRNIFNTDILVFDTLAAEIFGRISANRRAIGRPIATMDAMIAAICIANGATLATRNTKDFEGLDVKLINPFEAA